MDDLTDEMQEAVMIGIGIVLWLSIIYRDFVLGETPRAFREHAWNPPALYLEKANIEVFFYWLLYKVHTYNLQLFLSHPSKKWYTIDFSTVGERIHI